MSDQESWSTVLALSENYVGMVRAELSERWEKWQLDLANREMHEVIGALLARQVTLSYSTSICTLNMELAHFPPSFFGP